MESTAVRKPFHTSSRKNIITIGKHDTQAQPRHLTRNGQALLPMVELIEQSNLAVDELIDVLARASIEAKLRLSVEGIAGPPPSR
jgi:hypothetical protein